ncbi:hypothetical protein F5Y10DRAFT_254867 [Nemania abortiva]|nr:hypothetical protein F5Y10DRAFT_254867 [Nemania abortiva]
MLRITFFALHVLLIASASLPPGGTVPPLSTRQSLEPSTCRYLPGDSKWPSPDAWAELNNTVGGMLLRGAPVGQPCYGPSPNVATCAKVQENWQEFSPFLEDPVNVISPYFENTECNPFYGPLSSNMTERNATCSLGGLAYYAINVTGPEAIRAGINFAREHNVRLIIKNTGHDVLGRSTGQGSLALWTHYLKDYSFFQYKSKSYKGPAARISAGIQVEELYVAAAAAGYRATAGTCQSVGAAGGWIQSAGHGPLSAKYGLGSDQTLEFEVITADGRHLNASRVENPDLYWALSGGGPGNYAVVLSVTLKVYDDGPVAGSRLSFAENDSSKYWAAVEAWERHLLVLDTIPGFQSLVLLSKGIFSLDYVTLPDGSGEDITTALVPFYEELERLGVTVTRNETVIHDTFLQHYQYYEGNTYDSRNVTMGSRMIPRSLVANAARLPQLTKVYKQILATENAFVYIIGQNVTHARVGNKPSDNAVLPAWRDSLFIINFGIIGDPLESSEGLVADLATANDWQLLLREITPRGGSYMNEATFDFPYWKEDYYGDTYDRLVAVKKRYDPGYVLWSTPSAGGDAYTLRRDGHLCKA